MQPRLIQYAAHTNVNTTEWLSQLITCLDGFCRQVVLMSKCYYFIWWIAFCFQDGSTVRRMFFFNMQEGFCCQHIFFLCHQPKKIKLKDFSIIRIVDEDIYIFRKVILSTLDLPAEYSSVWTFFLKSKIWLVCLKGIQLSRWC